MARDGSGVRTGGDDQFAPAQILERGLHSALGKTSGVGERA